MIALFNQIINRCSTQYTTQDHIYTHKLNTFMIRILIDYDGSQIYGRLHTVCSHLEMGL